MQSFRVNNRYGLFLWSWIMFDEEEFGKKPVGPKDLEPLSLDELGDYIADLKAEIARSEGEIERKKAHMNAAASVFKD